MSQLSFTDQCESAISITTVVKSEFETMSRQLSQQEQMWLSVNQFKAETGQFCLLPDADGNLKKVIFVIADLNDFWSFGLLPLRLPESTFKLDGAAFSEKQLLLISYAWALGAYQFDKYKKNKRQPATLCLDPKIDRQKLDAMCESVYLVRDLINTPAEDLRPTTYAEIVKSVAKQFKAKYRCVSGNELQKEFPLVHYVGRAGEQPPCLVEINWGKDSDPSLTLVGKGVCFDSGGLDIKPAAGMALMKKDMGGSATVLGLAQYIMSLQLPIRLRLILPLAENAISANATRPGDVLRSRSGVTVEIGNTDAEGRLILADSLTYACEKKPKYLIDMATLTGAAKIATGPDIPAFFTSHDSLALKLEQSAKRGFETICRLPLYKPYRPFLNSNIADINNISAAKLGGAITAALFLNEFVSDDIPWVHFDIMAWNTRHRPGRPAGGAAMGLMTLFDWVSTLTN